VFEHCGDYVVAAAQQSVERQVERIGAIGGEDHLSRIVGSEQSGDGAAGVGDIAFDLLS
jgi:hypothetical protein